MVAESQAGDVHVTHATRIHQLEQEGRFPELATELASLVAHAQGSEKAELLARLGEVRLRLDDVSRALSAFRESLEEDPLQAVSRRWLEVMLAEPDHALEAAELLEPIYESEFRKVPHAASMLLAVLELRANRTSDPDERIALWVQIGAYFDHAALTTERQREISGRMLRRTALDWSGGVAKWIERVMRTADENGWRVETLLSALDQPIPEASAVQELALAAGEALDAAGRLTDALLCFERALATDPSSPEVVARIDALLSTRGEAPEARVQRYQVALGRATEPHRRASLLYALGQLQEATLGNTRDAIETWQRAIAEEAALERAHEALLAAYEKVGDVAGLERELEWLRGQLQGPALRNVVVRLSEVSLRSGRSAEALQRCLPLVADAEGDDPVLDLVERCAEDARDLAALRAVHERRVAVAPDRVARARALEALGLYFSEAAGDTAEAARIWKQAAELLAQSADEVLDAQRLYERVLEVNRADGSAARRLVELYAASADWTKLPDAFLQYLKALPEVTSAVDLLLALEGRAVQAGATAEFAQLVDDVLFRLGNVDVGRARRLLVAKARVLTQAARFDEAAKLYENLIESFADESDVRAYVGLCEASPTEQWRHAKRRWLFEWRTARADDPVAVLVHWAAVEEQEFGDVRAAIDLLERAALKDSNRGEVFRELARLRIGTGDVAAALASLGKVRELGGHGDVRAVELTMAKLLIERLDQPADALPLLEEVLEQLPNDAEARALALGLCGNVLVYERATEMLSRAAERDAPESQAALYEALLAATDVFARDGKAPAELGRRRRAWFERLLSLTTGEQALAFIERAAIEFPREEAIWKSVEELALRLQEPLGAVRAYERAIRHTSDSALAESLGKRLVAFADQNVGNPRALASALEAVLALAPGARWAFDRVKFALSSQQRWDALFPLYDRVIEASTTPSERAELLDEAAIAARDVAGDSERAIRYWEQYFALRPEDARVDLALERLYERQRRTAELIAHLSKREPALDGDDVIPLRERIAGLWLELADGRAALAVIEGLPKETASARATLALLERVFGLELPADAEKDALETQRKVAHQAARLLKQRYARAEQNADVARIVSAELRGARDRTERVQLLQQLSELRRGLDEPQAEFDALGELLLLEPDVRAHRARLGELATALGLHARLAELIVRAADGASDRALFPKLLFDAAGILLGLGERERASGLYARVLEECTEEGPQLDAAHRLERLLLECGRPADRCAVLERMASLEPGAEAQRAAWLESARVALEELSDAPRAARAHRILLERAPHDRALHDGLIRALLAALSFRELATALEQRAALEPESPRAHRDLSDMARLLAEKLGAPERAIDTWYAIRARFGTDAESFEALSSLLEAQGRWDELATLLAQEAEVARLKAPLFQRLAEVHRQHTGNLGAALIAYVQAGDVVSASELLGAHPQLLTDDPTLTLEVAAKLERGGRIEQAERVLRAQIDHYGPRRPEESVLSHLRLAELLSRSGQRDRARTELLAAAERHPSSAEILAALGQVSFDAGDLDLAEQSYRALLLLPGRSAASFGRAEVYLRLSEIAARRGDAQRADDHVASAFEAALGNDEEANGLERALKQRGRADLLERAIMARIERTRAPGKILAALWDLLDVSAVFGEVEPTVAERVLKLADRAARDLEGTPARAEAARTLVAIYDRLGQSERALAALDDMVSQAASAEERDHHALEIARRLLAVPERQKDARARLWDLMRRDAARPEVCELLLQHAEEGVDELLELMDEQLAAAEKRSQSERAEALRVQRALILERAGRHAEALATYRKLAATGPHRQRALPEIVRLLELSGASETEIGDAREALLEFENGPEAAVHALRLAALRKQQGDEAGVERALERGFLMDPTRADIRDELFASLAERGRSEHAAELLERAVELAPDDGVLRLRLGMAYRACGAVEQALTALDAALAARAPEGDVRRERAAVLEAAGRADDALAELDAANNLVGGLEEELLSAIVRTNAWSDSERWALRAADLSGERGQRAAARRMLGHWAERHPDSVPVLSRLGRLASLDRDFPAAIDVFRRLTRLERGPAQRAAVLALAKLCEAAGRPQEAALEVERAIAEGADTAELRRELGKLYAQAGARDKQARLLLDEARTAKQPARGELLLKAADLFASERAWDDALSTIDEFHAAEPDRVEGLLVKAKVLAGRSSFAEGRAFLQSHLDPRADKKRSKHQARLHRALAELHLAEDELVEALSLLVQAHQLDKSDVDAAWMLGLLAFDLDQIDLAAGALRAFLAVKENAAGGAQLSKAYFVLACIEHAKGQKTVARRMVNRALEVDSANDEARRLLATLA